MKIAVTGGTGFVGAHLLRIAPAEGFAIRALARRAQPEADGITWIAGDLADTAALRTLCQGADAVIHIAGVINARTPAAFDAGNVEGTRAMLAAAEAAGVRRFIHVSSLAAREPRLSAYGASKARSEAVVAASPLDWTIVRPPMVYGPGDRETLAIFRMVKAGVAALPRGGTASMIHAEDLSRALLALPAAPEASGQTYEPDDGAPLRHAAFARLIAGAIDRVPLIIPLPGIAVTLGAVIDTLSAKLTGRLPKLSFDRARYLAHKDWVSRLPMAGVGGWQPRYDGPTGIAETAAWYRAEGWL